MSVIPWPIGSRLDLTPGSQKLLSFSGLFVQLVWFEPASIASDFYFYKEEPRLTNIRAFSNSLVFPTTPYDYKSISFELFGGSDVTVYWDYNSCPLEFLVLKGKSRYNAFVKQGEFSTFYELTFNSSHEVTLSFDETDHYYFIIDNPRNCYPSRSVANFNVQALSYETNTAFHSCRNYCEMVVDYESKTYVVIQPPTVTLDGSSVSVYYEFKGRWYSYFLLYGGLGLTMCCCIPIARYINKKKNHQDNLSIDNLQPTNDVIQPYQEETQTQYYDQKVDEFSNSNDHFDENFDQRSPSYQEEDDESSHLLPPSYYASPNSIKRYDPQTGLPL